MEEGSKKMLFSFSLGYMNKEVLEPLVSLPFKLYPQSLMLLKFMSKVKGKYHGIVMFLDKDGHDATREFDFYAGGLGPNSTLPWSTREVVKWLNIFLFVFIVSCFICTRRVAKEKDEF